MPRPPAVVGACKPFDSLLSTTQGTGTQGKTRGQDPGPRPQFAPQEEEENAVQFRLAIEGDTGGGVLDIMESENFEFYTPSDDDNDDLFPKDIIDLSLQEKGRNASEFSGDLLPTKRGRIPRYLSKRTRRQRKAIAKAAKAEEDKAEDYRVSYGFTDNLYCVCHATMKPTRTTFSAANVDRVKVRDMFQIHCAHPRLR